MKKFIWIILLILVAFIMLWTSIGSISYGISISNVLYSITGVLALIVGFSAILLVASWIRKNELDEIRKVLNNKKN